MPKSNSMDTPLTTRIAPFLAALQARQTTGRAVARQLGVTEDHLCRVLKHLKIERLPAERVNRKEKRALRQARNAYRLLLARTLPLHEAAAQAHCHPRTLKRLLAKHP